MKDKVKLVSSDGHEFLIETYIAEQSETLALFLNLNKMYVSTKPNTVRLPINSMNLKRIIDFMCHKFGSSKTNILEFKISDDESLDLLEIASYLKI